MIIITLVKRYKKTESMLSADFKWCYIGKDVRKRERISNELGEGKRFFLKDRLHKVSYELRKPFLDFVAELGKHQKNPLNWWASRFSSKSPFITDFFLLVCYARLVEKLIEERHETLCVIVEDQWLFEFLSSSQGNKEVTFIGKSHLWKDKLIWTLRGITYRILLFGYLLLEKWLMLALRGKGLPSGEVAIHSCIEQRAFNGGYIDHYTGGLGDFLASKGIRVIRPTYLVFPLSLSKKTAKCKKLWPIILDLRVRDMLRCLLERWRPEIPKSPAIAGMDVDILIRREVWEEFALTTFNSNAMYYYAFKGFFSRGWSGTFIYNYENLSFEKMMCMAGKQFPNIRLVGYRDTPTPWFYLSTFLAEGEKDIMPLPKSILTIGNYTLRMFKESGNYPEGILKNGGAWRYDYLWKEEQPEAVTKKNTILIATPIDPFITRTMILDIAGSFSERDGIKFLIKCHPITPFHRLGVTVDAGIFEVVDEPVDSLLQRADTVIYTASTVGLEFLVKGKTVIRYVVENLINMDSLEGIEKELYFTCYEGACRETILKAVQRGPAMDEQLRRVIELKAEYFGRVKHEVWLEETIR